MKKQTTKKSLPQRIKDKFGTITKFIALADLDKRRVRADLYRDNPKALQTRAEIEAKLEATPVPQKVAITEDERSQLKGALYSQYKNARDFCNQHPTFSASYISNLTTGVVAYRDAKAEKVFEILNLN